MSRIAVVGSGISGMAAAYLLSRKHEVHLLEREHRLGGHTHTHAIPTSRGVTPIDTGFIVHNDRTYPNLVKLFQKLGVERQKSDMSFGVSCQKTGFEYSSRGLGGLFAQKSNWLRLRHYRFLREILRFNREAPKVLDDPAGATMTLGEWTRANDFGETFSRYYLFPMAAAVWSTSPEEVEDFPAVTLVRFFTNHGFLGIDTHPQWYAVKGGSSQYIAPLTAPYKERIRTGIQVSGITRSHGAVQVKYADGRTEAFDEIVFACHGPQVMGLLSDATPQERAVLEGFSTSRNETVLHTDEKLLPTRPNARASWNYHVGDDDRAVTLTYHVNRLQSLAAPEPYCVTLNATSRIKPERILRELTYFHPLMTLTAIRGQARWREISGQNRTHFCGAYWFYGFHEDGLNSAIRVAQSLGVDWRPEA
jgi:predicted NAD/FAD-binding protein